MLTVVNSRGKECKETESKFRQNMKGKNFKLVICLSKRKSPCFSGQNKNKSRRGYQVSIFIKVFWKLLLFTQYLYFNFLPRVFIQYKYFWNIYTKGMNV